MTAALAVPHALDTCIRCGATDDHPKVHFGNLATVHHDCATIQEQGEIFGGNHSQHPLMAARLFKAALDGTHGDDLREFIGSQEMRDFGEATMLKATAYANDILDATFNGGASGTFVLGATTYTLPLRCKFLSTVSTAGSAGTEWTTAAGYTAGGVSLSGLWTVAASAAAKANTGAVTVTNAPAQTWADNEIQDSTGTPKRMVAKGTPSLAKTVNLGDTCTIAIGSLTGAEV